MPAEAGPHGILPVDKEPGPTSHDVVSRARRALGTRRIGHTGTLDPFASGLLLLCVGNATRIAEYVSGLDKRYDATVRLGIATDTEDHTGTVVTTAAPDGVSQADVEAALAPLRGEVLQIPPQYSAKKRGGERAYAAARQGRSVELAPVPVRIERLDLVAFELPHVRLDVSCSTGTYIRAIARDLGRALGVGAHLTTLRRTAIGMHDVAGAITLEELAEPGRAREALLPTLDVLHHLPRAELSSDAAAAVRHGRAVDLGADAMDAPVVVMTDGDTLLGIGACAGGVLRPRKVLQ